MCQGSDAYILKYAGPYFWCIPAMGRLIVLATMVLDLTNRANTNEALVGGFTCLITID